MNPVKNLGGINIFTENLFIDSDSYWDRFNSHFA